MSECNRSNWTQSSPTEIIIIENHFYSPTSAPEEISPEENSPERSVSLERRDRNGEKESEKSRAISSVKRRIKNSWNNTVYDNHVSKWIMKRRASFDRCHPLWLLGKMYSLPPVDEQQQTGIDLDRCRSKEIINAFYEDFTSRLWFTYRKDFAKLNGCRLKSDCGWGCMLRCGQMLLAQTLVCHILGRDWISFHDQPDSSSRYWHRQIVDCFIDCPKKPFSLHTLVDIGLAYGKRGGDWYGPASTAAIIRDAVSNCQLPLNTDLKRALENLSVYVAQDGVVYLDELDLSGADYSTDKTIQQQQQISPVSKSNHGRTSSRALLLIIPLRLGTDAINPVYIDHLKTLLSLKYCVGILGGRPRHSMFFVGWQRDAMIYLDPHYCQDAIDVLQGAEYSLETFHCKWPKKIPFSDIDPSCAVGFYLRPGTDFSDFLAELTGMVEMPDSHSVAVKHPLFSVMKRKPAFEDNEKKESAVRDRPRRTSGEKNRQCRRLSSASCKGEYAFL